MVLMENRDKKDGKGFKTSDTGRRIDFMPGETKDVPVEFVGRAEVNGLFVVDSKIEVKPIEDKKKGGKK